MTRIIPLEEAKNLQTKDYRGCLIKAVEKDKVSIDRCDLSTLIHDIEILPRYSGSDTLLAKGKLNYSFSDDLPLELRKRLENTNNNVILKISFENLYDNSLMVESEIYSRIINKLYFDNYTPNVILSYGHYSCETSKFIKGLKGRNRNNFDDFIFLYENKQNTHITNILILEYSSGSNLRDFLKNDSSKLVFEDYQSILFQIIYTIQVFLLFGLKHNDLHWGNLLIEEVKPTTYIYIVSPKTYFEVPVKYLVKIFDFNFGDVIRVNTIQSKELGSIENLDNNSINSMCISYGICKQFNDKFDLFTVLGYFQRYITSIKTIELKRELLNFIYKIADKRLFKVKWGFPYRLCKLKNGKCQGNFAPNDKLVNKPIQALFKFKDFKREMKIFQYDAYPYVYRLYPM